MKQYFVSALLSLSMVLTMIPSATMAAEIDDTNVAVVETETEETEAATATETETETATETETVADKKATVQLETVPVTDAETETTVTAEITEDAISTLADFDTTIGVPEDVMARGIDGGIVITWTASANADGYDIYDWSIQDQGYRFIDEVRNVTTYTHIVTDTNYHRYYIKPYKIVNNEKVYGGPTASSEPSDEVMRNIYIGEVQLNSVKSDGNGGIKVSWDKVDDVTGYFIYRCLSTEDDLDIIDLTESNNVTTYTDKSGVYGKSYSYAVGAYVLCYDTEGNPVPAYLDDDLECLDAKRMPGDVKLTSLKDNGKSGLVISWNKTDGADGYEILRRTSTKDKWTLYKDITSKKTTSYTNTFTKSENIGKRFYYTIRSYAKVNGKKVYGSYKAGLNAVVCPAKPKSYSASATMQGGISMSWQSVKLASGYRIYRKEAFSMTAEWKSIKTISSGKTQSYRDATAKAGVAYKYMIKSYRTVGGNKIWSAAVYKDEEVLCTPAKVTLNSVKASSGQKIKVSWSKVSDCTAYEVYRKTAGGKWQKIATRSAGKTSYTDTTCKKGTTYYYTVRVYKSVKGVKTYGEYNTKGKKVVCK